nr:alpha/beta hydrolase family protein [Aliamphritea ceti]
MAPIVLSEHLNTIRKHPLQTTDSYRNWLLPAKLKLLTYALFFSGCALFTLSSAAEDKNQGDTVNMEETSGMMQPADGMTETTKLPRSIPNPAAQRAAALAKSQSPDTEVIWLETNKETQLSLYMPSGSAESYGGIMLFPGSMSTPDWPDIIRPLRIYLSDQGWATLSVALPDPNPFPIPTRDMQAKSPADTTSNTDSGADSTATSGESMATEAMQDDAMSETMAEEKPEAEEPYIDKLSRITSAASTVLSEREQNRQIIIGVGTGAAWAAAYISQAQDDQNIRLLMIDPRQPADPEAPRLNELIALLDSETVLDLYFEDSELSKTMAKQRLRISRRNKLPDYQQIKINQRPDDSKREQQWLAKKVRGILKTHVIDADFARTARGRTEAKEAMQLMPGS